MKIVQQSVLTVTKQITAIGIVVLPTYFGK
jgi:hypothetical protein